MKRLFLCIFLIQFSYSWAQAPWLYENTYFEGKQVLETYDGGTLILANDEDFFGPTKLFKLDGTGEIIWEHTFEQNESTLPLCMAEDSQGNIIIGGKTFRYNNNYSDGFLIKLNPCGKMLWFTILQTEGNYGVYVDKLTLDENDNIIVVEYNGDINNWEYYEDTTLKKYNPDGQLLWSSVLLPEEESGPERVITCADGGYLVESDYFAPPYYDQESNVLYLRATLVKTDSLGNVEWRHFYRWEQDTQDTIYGSSCSGSAVEISNGEFIAIAAKRETPNFRHDLYRINTSGELVWSRDVSEENTTYDRCRMVLDKDSNLIFGTNFAEGNQNFNQHTLEIYKFNQQGDVLNYWVNNIQTSLLRDFRWNRDSTSLYVLPGSKISPNGNWSLYAFKFNIDSIQLDTFATEDNNEYDYYCPEGVVDLNFEFPELSVGEQPEVVKEQLKIAPNPARNFTYLYFDITDFNRSAKLEIYNMQGALVKSYPLQASIGRVKEDLDTYPKGMHVVSLIVNDRLIESSKMVVE